MIDTDIQTLMELIFEQCGVYDFMQTMQKEKDMQSLFKLLSICGKMDLYTFEQCIDRDFIQEHVAAISNEEIIRFIEICKAFRIKYHQYNLELEVEGSKITYSRRA